MSLLRRSRRGGQTSREFPLHEMRALMRDGRVWFELGVVSSDNGAHYHVDTDNDGKRRVMIDVQTIPGGLDLTCRLATKPCWYIPTPGTTVAVAIPAGEIDHCPSIVGILDSGAADEDISDQYTLVATELALVLKATEVKLGGVDADQQLIKGNARKSDEDTFLTGAGGMQLTFQSMAAACTGPLAPLAAGFTALATAAQTFQLTLAGHLSDVSKTK